MTAASASATSVPGTSRASRERFWLRLLPSSNIPFSSASLAAEARLPFLVPTAVEEVATERDGCERRRLDGFRPRPRRAFAGVRGSASGAEGDRKDDVCALRLPKVPGCRWGELWTATRTRGRSSGRRAVTDTRCVPGLLILTKADEGELPLVHKLRTDRSGARTSNEVPVFACGIALMISPASR